MDILGVMVLSVATAVGGGTGPRFIDRPDARFLAEAAQIVWIAVFVGAAIFALGMLAGSAGGIVRDILGREIPAILVEGELYATASRWRAGIHLSTAADTAVSLLFRPGRTNFPRSEGNLNPGSMGDEPARSRPGFCALHRRAG